MTGALKGQIIPETKFCFPFRMILAGSSGAGKTHFAGQLLQRDLFDEKVTTVYYYYPVYLSEYPVDWHQTLNIPVIYNHGLPTEQELTEMPEKSCVVIDDSFDTAVQSPVIDHLFRVISGKRKLAVMIMTQNNFSKGKYGRDIRNSCNFSVLFRNCCDTSINENIARMSGLKLAYNAAWSHQRGQEYPYILIDQSQRGQLTPYRLYTNIFGRYPEVWSVKGMKGYVIGAQDFETYFKVKENKLSFTAKYEKTAETSKPSLTTSHVSDLEISSWDTDSESEHYHAKSPNQITKVCESTYDPFGANSESRTGRYSGPESRTANSRSESSGSESGRQFGGGLHKNRKRPKLLGKNC